MKTGITFNLDATSCYDCILALLSTLACHSVGLEINVCQMHTETLTHAEFCLKTSIGISDGLYQHTETTPIHGTGQGSGNSPQIWCFISNALFNAFASEAHGACFASFNGDIRQTIHMIGFVDDCSQQLNYFSANPQPDPDTLITQMKTEAQLWRDLLYASGGDLKLPKCFFQLIQSDFKPNGIPFLCNRIFAPPVTVQNQTMTVLITQKNNYTSNQTLDCYVNPGNKMHTQAAILLKKSNDLASLLQSNILTCYEVHINYWMLYLPLVTYPFAVTNLTPEQCYGIQTKFLKEAVPRSSSNRTMALAIQYGPTSYACAGFTELITEQHHATITMALKHLRTPGFQPGQTLRILLSWVQAFHGISTFVWSNPNLPLPFFPAPWTNGILPALQSLNASIILPPEDPILFSKLRKRDVFIMDVALHILIPAGVISR